MCISVIHVILDDDRCLVSLGDCCLYHRLLYRSILTGEVGMFRLLQRIAEEKNVPDHRRSNV